MHTKIMIHAIMTHLFSSDEIEEAISGRLISIIFDGKMHVCKAMVIFARYLTDDWVIKQDAYVCRLMLLTTGKEVARQN